MSLPWRRFARRVATVGAIASTVVAARNAAPPVVDQRLTTTLTRSRGSVVDRAVGALTDIGSVYGLAGCSATLALAGEVRLGLRTAVAGSVAWVAAQLTKDLVDRERPYELGAAELLIEPPHGSSWPSGHAAVAGAMATTIGRSQRPVGRMVAWVVATGVAASRLQVGAHHATDAVAGLALGALAAEASQAALDRLLPPPAPDD